MVYTEKIAVFGLGYVGLPLSLSFSLSGCEVIGIDISKNLVDEINNGVTHHTEKFQELTIQEILNQQIQDKRFTAVNDVKSIPNDVKIYIVTVGIPIKDDKHDDSPLIDCCTSLGSILKKGDLVIIRSTVIPGTTEDVLLPILEKESGLKAGTDFYLAYSSERIAEGKAFEEFAYMPTVVGAVNGESLKRAVQVLSIVCKTEVIKANNIKVVETAKVIENVQRDVNIAMVQEFARFTEKLGIDIYDVIKVANTHKRVNLLFPGPGVGGYCIPNAYHYLEPKAKELGVNLDILKIARQENQALPEVIVNMAIDKLQNMGQSIVGKKIAVFGIAMKDYSNDDRLSPPITIINLFQEAGADVYAYDPIVPTKYTYKYDSIGQTINGADIVAILAKQTVIERELTPEILFCHLKTGSIILDTRNMLSDYKEDIIKHGIVYMTL